MSKRKTSTLGDLAAGAAHGRQVVASVGQLDGPLLLALQRLNLCPMGDTDAPTSTWAEGVAQAGKREDQVPPCP